MTPAATRLRPQSEAGPNRSTWTTAWALVAVLAVALNLRIAIAAISPVLDAVRGDVDLSREAAGLLTTLPVLCFAVLAPVAAFSARRFGNEAVVTAAMGVLVAGILARSLGGPGWLFTGTLLFGAAIAVGNVLVPAVVKQHLAPIAGVAMAVYTAGLTPGAALASWGTAVLYEAGMSWEASLAVGAVPALLGGLAFGGWALVKRRQRVRSTSTPAVSLPGVGVWRAPTAWQLTLFFAGQSFLFYAMLAWLPVVLQDQGVGISVSGAMLSLYSLLGIVGALVVPPLAVRRPDQRVLALAVAVGWIVGIGGLLAFPASYLLWSLVLGVVQGAGISLAMTLIVLRARDEGTARDLSGMVQMGGYTVAAGGPLLMGALRDGFGSWDAALLLLVGVAMLMLVAGLGAGRDRMIG